MSDVRWWVSVSEVRRQEAKGRRQKAGALIRLGRVEELSKHRTVTRQSFLTFCLLLPGSWLLPLPPASWLLVPDLTSASCPDP